MKQFLEILSENNKISAETVLSVSQFIAMNQTGHNFQKLKDEETDAKPHQISKRV